MFVKNPEEFDTNQHRSRVRGIVSMHTRGKVCNYVTGRNDQSAKPSVIYEDNKCAIFLAKNRQVVIRTKYIDIRHHFMWDMVEENYVDIQYIWIEDKPEDIMRNKTLEADFARHIKRITEG